ncbi:PspC domain-containing protein [Geodermatophilus sp. URMC 63]
MTAAPPPAPPTEPPPVARPALRRSRTDKVVGGVAGGLAEYSGIDALLWRVGFVALTVAGGSGVLVYLLLWLLMPAGPRRPVDGAPAAPPGPRSPVAGITVAGLLIAVGLLVLVTRYTDVDLGPRGFLATALLVVGVGLVASSFARGRSPRGGLIAVGAVLSLAVLFTSSVDENDLSGELGDRSYQPESVAQVQSVYRLDAGDLDVDLSEIDVEEIDTPLRVRIDHGLGDLEVTVPEDADVRIEVENGVGEVDLFDGGSDGGLFRAEDGDGRVDLVLTIDHSLGDVEVSRA